MRNKTLILLALASLAAPALAQRSIPLLPTGAGDLGAGELVRIPTEKGLIPSVSHDAVDFTFALEADAQPTAPQQPFMASSREYFVDVDAATMRRGVSVFTTAPGALIRINPDAQAQRKGAASAVALAPSSLVVRDASGTTFSAQQGFDLLVNEEQLKATGVPFADGTIAFRLAAEIEAGALQIAAPNLDVNASSPGYTVHVFDQASDIALELAADAVDYLHGDTMTVHAGFTGAQVTADTIEGFVTSPSGRAWPIELRADGKGFVGQLTLDAVQAPGAGLWEAHLAARGNSEGLEVVRSVRTSFAAHTPTAGLGPDVSMRRARGSLELSFSIEVATPGRYEVRGTLFGTDATGALRPVAIGHSADWLDAAGKLALRFDAAGVTAPFELRDLRLLDQGRLGVLHRQASALRIDR